MAESPIALPKTLRAPGSGGCATIFAGFFVVPIAIGAFRFATMELGIATSIAAAVAFGTMAIVLLGVYYFFNSQMTFVIDSLGIAVSEQSRLGPFVGRARVVFDQRWDRVGEVVDVEQHRLTKHGSMNTSFKLVIGKHEIHSAQLGTMARDGDYLVLIEAVRAAVGPRLVTKEDLGDLEGPMRRLIDARLAKSAPESDEPKR